MAPRAGVPAVSITNGLDWQTAARGDFDPQRFSGEVANRHPSAILGTDRHHAHGPARRCHPSRQPRSERGRPQPALQAGRDSMALNRIRVGPLGDEAPPLRETAE
jgi:hypothetical protein